MADLELLDDPCLKALFEADSSSKLLFSARFCSSSLIFSALILSVSRSCSSFSRSLLSRSNLARSRSNRFTSSRSLRKKVGKVDEIDSSLDNSNASIGKQVF